MDVEQNQSFGLSPLPATIVTSIKSNSIPCWSWKCQLAMEYLEKVSLESKRKKELGNISLLLV